MYLVVLGCEGVHLTIIQTIRRMTIYTNNNNNNNKHLQCDDGCGGQCAHHEGMKDDGDDGMCSSG